MGVSSKGEGNKMTLDSALNFLVPAGIFIGIAVWIYYKAKKPIDSFFRTAAGWFKKGEGGKDEEDISSYNIEYRGMEY